jgi:hypothetical protein
MGEDLRIICYLYVRRRKKMFNEKKAGASVVIFLAFALAGFSQSRIIWGGDHRMKSGDFYSGILCEADSSLFLLKVRSEIFGGDGFYTEKFSSSALQAEGSFPLLLKDARIALDGKELIPQFEKVVMFNGEITVFLSAYDKSNDNNIAFAATFSPSRGVQTGLMELDRIENARRYNTGGFEFILSPDGLKLMVLRKKPYRKKENARLDLKLFDTEFNPLKVQSILLPYKDKNFEIVRHATDNEGGAVLMARIEREQKEFITEEPGFYYTLIDITSADSVGLSEYEIKAENKLLTDVDFMLTADGNIRVAGFYAISGREGLQGTFFMAVDRNRRRVISQSTKPFDKTLVLDFINEKKLSRGNGLPGFNIDHTVPAPDGGFYVISEQYLMSEVCGRDGRGFISCNYYYHYNSIVVFKIAETGEIMWNTVIPKFQFSINDEGFFSSYALAVSENSLHFVYNDHPKNIQLEKPREFKVMTKPSTAMAVHVKLNPDGSYTKEPLFSNKESKLILRPKFNGQLRIGEMILSAVPKNNYVKLGRILF